jgi:NTE family protein
MLARMGAPAGSAAARAASPVVDAGPETAPQPTAGTALCLSGGGYRAMLFHTGALLRLNELGWLPQIDRVSSVSGGSITAGVLASAWQRLTFENNVATNFESLVVDPVQRLAGKTIDLPAILLGLVRPGGAARRTAAAYRKHLFGPATLQDLPDTPSFVFNATNLQSGVLLRFSKQWAWDYRVGKVASPTTELAVVVAASAAFPPFLGPLRLDVPPTAHVPNTGDDDHGEEPNLEVPPYTTKLVLSDGGVYDNLGLEAAWKSYNRILISDGGGKMAPEAKPRSLWPLQLLRVLNVIDNQVRSLRKRQAISAYTAGIRTGTYWGIRTNIANYETPQALPAPFEETIQLARLGTRLSKTPPLTQQRLVNWGYAVCDAAMRKYVAPAQPPSAFPYPPAGV